MVEKNSLPELLEPSWLAHLDGEFERPYMQQLRAFLRQREAQGQRIYPPADEIYAALERTPVDAVKVVILGQDPYHGPGQAHGLCFSVRPGVRPPPSLVNVYKELATDTGFVAPSHGCLNHWADQGVLLLNSVLTVEQGQAASHRGKGWETFTDAVIKSVNDTQHGVVFLLWGSYAQKKGAQIDARKHLILKAPHPSPLSAYRGFFGCQHFSQCNLYLENQKKSPIDWQLAQN